MICLYRKVPQNYQLMHKVVHRIHLDKIKKKLSKEKDYQQSMEKSPVRPAFCVVDMKFFIEHNKSKT